MQFTLGSVQSGGSAKTTAHMSISPEGDLIAVPAHTPGELPGLEHLWEVAVLIDGTWSTVAWGLSSLVADAIAEPYLRRWPAVQIWHQGEMVAEHSGAAADVTIVRAPGIARAD